MLIFNDATIHSEVILIQIIVQSVCRSMVDFTMRAHKRLACSDKNRQFNHRLRKHSCKLDAGVGRCAR